MIHPRKRNSVVALASIWLAALPSLLWQGCATKEDHKLDAGQVTALKHTKTALVIVDDVEGGHKAFFTDTFAPQLAINGVTVITNLPPGATASDYDAVISLRCYYLNAARINLPLPVDLQAAHGKSLTGVGKRIGCRLIVSHKVLDQLFEGDIEQETKWSGQLTQAEFDAVAASTNGFSAFLEQNAQRRFESALKGTKGWLDVLNMKSQP